MLPRRVVLVRPGRQLRASATSAIFALTFDLEADESTSLELAYLSLSAAIAYNHPPLLIVVVLGEERDATDSTDVDSAGWLLAAVSGERK